MSLAYPEDDVPYSSDEESPGEMQATMKSYEDDFHESHWAVHKQNSSCAAKPWHEATFEAGELSQAHESATYVLVCAAWKDDSPSQARWPRTRTDPGPH